MASSTFSGSPVTVTQLGSGAPLCGKRMSTWTQSTQSQGGRGLRRACANDPFSGGPLALQAQSRPPRAHCAPHSCPRCDPQRLPT